MKLRNLVLPLLLVLSCSTAFGQYTTSYEWGLYDMRPFATSGSHISLWNTVPGGGTCKAHTLSTDYSGNLWCLGISDNYIYEWSNPTTGWVKQSAMGSSSNIIALAVLGPTQVYKLQSNTPCPAPNGEPYLWNGSTWTALPNCYNQLSVAVDGMLVASSSVNQGWYSTDGGSTWTLFSGSWSYVQMPNAFVGCGISGSTVKIININSGTVTLTTTLTPPWTPVGCTYLIRDGMVFIWDSSGHVRTLNHSAGTWDTVGVGSLALRHLSGTTNISLFAEDSSGRIYHWNSFAPFLQATTSGTWNHCPLGPMNCPSGVYHQHSLRVTMPNGVGGAQYSSRLPSTQYFSGSSWDASPGCDPLIGASDDPNCTPTVTGQDFCEASNTVLDSPPGPPAFNYNSYSYVTFDNSVGPEHDGVLNLHETTPCTPCGTVEFKWSCGLKAACATGSCTCGPAVISDELEAAVPSNLTAAEEAVAIGICRGNYELPTLQQYLFTHSGNGSQDHFSCTRNGPDYENTPSPVGPVGHCADAAIN